ncbi:phosphotransferase family protein [Ferroacidibacillus organovorans]|uniref:Phosphotransferase family protein n=1 Tax=Ferroacidibacillus organovorans TaxID=1765683 RepID=A0A162T271_9BACL|nr:phosphotransferase family protein [Ferroacidibacillus organovorans]KYP80386.1 hypothetical protein AYJ22_11260 [Ferroacidibacillus organovorans]OAG84797.1 hypothetical protein AYW79_15030 [Ferroacidibacillus organovorans]OPG17268.1 phosphotransferase family protein [Ferroacidibacillus organovorans]
MARREQHERVDDNTEIIDVRKGEELDLSSIVPLLKEGILDLPEGEWSVRQYAAGRSNLTYLIKCGAWEAVLRRPPLGPVAPKSHDMLREARILSLICDVFPLAPKPYLVVSDASILGAPFYVMERKTGVCVDGQWPTAYLRNAETGAKMSEALLSTMVRLHNLSIEGEAIAKLGRPDGYMRRQTEGVIQRFSMAQTVEIPEAEGVAHWLLRHIPEHSGNTLIHNDLKFNNMLLSPSDAALVTGVLDWEMTTLGDPLSDLAITLSYWVEADDEHQGLRGVTSLGERYGFMTRRKIAEAYAKRTGRDLLHMDFYMVFASFKAAVIAQQIYARYQKGQTSDPRFAELGEHARRMILRAHDIARGAMW